MVKTIERLTEIEHAITNLLENSEPLSQVTIGEKLQVFGMGHIGIALMDLTAYGNLHNNKKRGKYRKYFIKN